MGLEIDANRVVVCSVGFCRYGVAAAVCSWNIGAVNNPLVDLIAGVGYVPLSVIMVMVDRGRAYVLCESFSGS